MSLDGLHDLVRLHGGYEHDGENMVSVEQTFLNVQPEENSIASIKPALRNSSKFQASFS